MSEDFDDLFSSPKRHAPAGLGAYDDEDEYEATANPFADLQSSSLLTGSAYNKTQQAQNGLSDYGAGTDRLETSSSPIASTSRSTSAPSTPSSINKRDIGRSANGSYSDELDRENEGGRNRVSVSPFGHHDQDQDPMASTTLTIGRADEDGERENGGRRYNTYSGDKDSPFDARLGSSNSSSSSGLPTPSLAINDFIGDDGFREQISDIDKPYERDPDRDRAEEASIRTVGLESDAASMRSGNVAGPSVTTTATRVLIMSIHRR